MEKTIHWLLDHRRFLIFLSVFLLLVLLVVNFFSNNAFIYLEVSGDKKSSITTYASSDSGNTKVGNDGLLLVSRQTKSLLVTAGTTIKTQTTIQIPWYGYMQKKVQVIQDTNAEKVAYRSTTGTTCTSYSPTLDKLLYYACRNPKTILQYDTPTLKSWSTKKVADIYYSNGEAKPYMGGVIGITHVHATDAKQMGDIVYTTESGKAISYEAPEETDHEAINSAKIFTDTNNPENNRFVFVDKVGDIYLGTPKRTSGIAYKKIPTPNNYDSIYNETHCAVIDDSAYCYRGKGAVGDAPHDTSLEKSAGYELISASFTETNSVTRKITGADGVLNIDGIVVSDGRIFAKAYKKLYRFDEVNDSYVMNELLQNVDSVAGGNELYVVQNGGVYKLNKSTSDFHQVFYSDNVKPAHVYAVTSKVYVIAHSSGDKKTTYAYLLNDKPNETPGKRIIDLLPLRSGTLTGSTDNDFVGNKLLITLPVVTTKATKGQSGIDTGEMEARKVDVLNALRGLDIPINEENVQFTY